MSRDEKHGLVRVDAVEPSAGDDRCYSVAWYASDDLETVEPPSVTTIVVGAREALCWARDRAEVVVVTMGLSNGYMGLFSAGERQPSSSPGMASLDEKAMLEGRIVPAPPEPTDTPKEEGADPEDGWPDPRQVPSDDPRGRGKKCLVAAIDRLTSALSALMARREPSTVEDLRDELLVHGLSAGDDELHAIETSSAVKLVGVFDSCSHDQLVSYLLLELDAHGKLKGVNVVRIERSFRMR